MSLPNVLFIGGTGVISSACARYAAELGHEVTALNRGTSTTHPTPEGVHAVTADVRDADSVRAALGDKEFDVVVDFLSFIPDHVQQQLDLFEGRTGQYVFISSASAYQTPPDPPAGHRVDTAAQPVLGVLPRQDRLRGAAARGIPRRAACR